MRQSELAAQNYYKWLLDRVHAPEYGEYSLILGYLFSREFYWVVPMDRNRAIGGIDMRNDFAMEAGYKMYFWRGCLPDYCTVLEMMISLAHDCEDRLMGDPDFGDRTHVWFWLMMNKLGLDWMTNSRFDEARARRIVDRFLNRTFAPDGQGGLFGRLSHDGDMRTIEWWYQLNYYLMEYYEF